MNREFAGWTRMGGARLTALIAVLASVSLTIVAFPAESEDDSAPSAENLELVEGVDGSRMISTITDLQEFESRAYLHDSNWNASIYIHDRFADLGLDVSYQGITVNGYPQRNVIAVLEGSDPEAPQYLFGAHYDSMTLAIAGYAEGNLSAAPGADDDASGVAATIELATILHEMTLNNTVKFVAFAAEETGLNGSSAFVQHELAAGTVYADTVIMDMIGYRMALQNRAFIFRDTQSNSMAKAVQDSVEAYSLDLTLTVVTGTDMTSSDHYPFWMAGYPSMLVIEDVMGGWPVNPYYHTENDTVDHLSVDQMEVVTQALLAGLLELQAEPEGSPGMPVLLITLVVVLVAVGIIITVFIIIRRSDDA